MQHRRTVITGLGILCPMANSADAFADALFAGKTCIGPITDVEPVDERFTFGGPLTDFSIAHDLPDVNAKRMMRYSQFALVATKRAIDDAQLSLAGLDTARIGTCFSTAIAGLGEAAETDFSRFARQGVRGVSPSLWAEATANACTSHVAVHFSLRGPSATLSAGCVSGVDAIAWGTSQIRAGNADVMIVGGTDNPFFPLPWAMMCRSGILAPAPTDGKGIPRPFSADHNGIVLVEGGTAVVLESETHARLRGAPIYGEVMGIASYEEALPMTHIDSTGAAFGKTIQLVLADAGLPGTAVDWVCAHGTGHPIADGSESCGIETALGDHAFHIPVSSIRGAVGQSFASGGGFQAAAACAAIARQIVPPTLNFTTPADGCRLDYVPNHARMARVRHVLVSAAAVGGGHGALLISKYER